MECIKCWKYSWRSMFCRECRDIKQNHCAMLSSNKNKLRKLLDKTDYNIERFDKFMLYTNNILVHWKVVMEYKEVDRKRTFENLLKIWIIMSVSCSVFFIFEIVLIS